MKISYGRTMWNSEGTFYSQRLLVSKDEFRKIQEDILQEIRQGFPTIKQYSGHGVGLTRAYFTPLQVEKLPQGDICFLKLTQARFLLRYPECRDRLKIDRNTYIKIEG